MPFNGSGTFVSLGLPDFPAVAGELILADQFNNTMNDVFTLGLTKCLTRDGQSPPTANIPMAGFKLTGLGDASAATDAVNLGQSFAKRGAIGAVDWDTRTSFGVYEGDSASLAGPATNFPAGATVGQLLVLNQGSNIVHIYSTSDTIYVRRRVSGTWTAWFTFSSGLVGLNAVSNDSAILKVSATSYESFTVTGMVAPFARNSAPTGWLKCNGAAVSRTTYARLFAAIGTTWGAGDGSTTFNVPELRGEFIRGWADGRAVDTGRAFASFQAEATLAHNHTASSGNNSVGHTHTFSDTSTSADVTHAHTISITSGNQSVNHTHDAGSLSAVSNGNHTHTVSGASGTGANTFAGLQDQNVASINTGSAGAHTHTISGTTTTNSANHTHLVSGTSSLASSAHTHDVSGTTSTNSATHTHTITVNNSSGAETRPRNYALLYCIKT